MFRLRSWNVYPSRAAKPLLMQYTCPSSEIHAIPACGSSIICKQACDYSTALWVYVHSTYTFNKEGRLCCGFARQIAGVRDNYLVKYPCIAFSINAFVDCNFGREDKTVLVQANDFPGSAAKQDALLCLLKSPQEVVVLHAERWWHQHIDVFPFKFWLGVAKHALCFLHCTWVIFTLCKNHKSLANRILHSDQTGATGRLCRSGKQ